MHKISDLCKERQENSCLPTHHGKMNADQAEMLLFVRSHAEPGTLERVLGPFTVANLMPHRAQVRHSHSGCLFIHFRFQGVSCDRATILAMRLRAMPCVRHVKLCLQGKSLQPAV